MIAIFKTGGKQYSVKPGQILKVEKLEGKKGDNLTFKNILAIKDGIVNNFGSPLVKGASIEAKILDQVRGEKIIVFKKRRRKNYRSTHGHRQYLTVVKIETILNGNKKASASLSSKKDETNKTQNKVKLTSNIKGKDDKKIVVKKTISKKTVQKKKNIKKKTTMKITKNKE